MQRRYVWSSENWSGLNSRLRKHDKVSFCVYDDGCRNEGDWALNFRSVIVFGHVEFVEDHAKISLKTGVIMVVVC